MAVRLRRFLLLHQRSVKTANISLFVTLTWTDVFIFLLALVSRRMATPGSPGGVPAFRSAAAEQVSLSFDELEIKKEPQSSTYELPYSEYQPLNDEPDFLR